MGRNLTNLPISASFQYLLQVSGSEVTDGLGVDVDNLTVTASYATQALTASYAENFDTPNLQQVTDAGATTTNAISGPRINLGGSGTNGVLNTYDASDNEILRATATGVQIGGLSQNQDLLHYGNTTQNGNVNVTGAVTASAGFKGDLAGNADTATSASHALNADNAVSSSYAVTASYAANAVTPTLQQVTDAGNTTTNNINVNNGGYTSTLTGTSLFSNQAGGEFVITGTTTTTGGLVLKGNGTNDVKIDLDGNTDTIYLTGSVDSQNNITAPTFIGALQGNADTATTASHAIYAETAGTATSATTAISSSHAVQADSATSASHALQADSATTATTATTATSASYVLGSNVDGQVTSALSASYALTASYLEGGAPASDLQAVLTAGNSATNDIALTGSIFTTANSSFNGVTVGTYGGARNTAVGDLALDGAGGAANDNVAVGYQALSAGLTGDYNIAVGKHAGRVLAGGSVDNIYLGWAAGFSQTAGNDNVMIGAVTGQNVSNASNNTLVGSQVAGNLSTGGNNTIVGPNGAGGGVSTGANNTILGKATGLPNPSNNIILADGAGNIKYQWDGRATTLTSAVVGNITSPTWVGGATTTIDCEDGNFFDIDTTLDATTIDFTNIKAGQTINVKFTSTDTTTGAVTWNAAIEWEGGTAIQPSGGSIGLVDVFTFVSFDGTSLQAVAVKNFS